MIEERNHARLNKNWKEADLIRDKLLDLGIEITDTSNGTKWKNQFYPPNLTFNIAIPTNITANIIVNLNSNCSKPLLDLKVLVASPKSEEPEPLACRSKTAISDVAIIISNILNMIIPLQKYYTCI